MAINNMFVKNEIGYTLAHLDEASAVYSIYLYIVSKGDIYSRVFKKGWLVIQAKIPNGPQGTAAFVKRPKRERKWFERQNNKAKNYSKQANICSLVPRNHKLL